MEEGEYGRREEATKNFFEAVNAKCYFDERESNILPLPPLLTKDACPVVHTQHPAAAAHSQAAAAAAAAFTPFHLLSGRRRAESRRSRGLLTGWLKIITVY